MPQFVVPQFIDVEDKIIGPITTRQFIMGVVAALLMFISYKLADFALFIAEAILILGFYALVAFVKINGRPFYYFIISVARSLKRAQLRVFSKQQPDLRRGGVKKSDSSGEDESAPEPARKVRPESRSLSSVSLLVDTGGKYRPEEILKNKNNAKS